MKSLKYSSMSKIKKQKLQQKVQSSILNTLKQDDQMCSNLLDTLSDDYLGYLEDLMGKKLIQDKKKQQISKQDIGNNKSTQKNFQHMQKNSLDKPNVYSPGQNTKEKAQNQKVPQVKHIQSFFQEDSILSDLLHPPNNPHANENTGLSAQQNTSIVLMPAKIVQKSIQPITQSHNLEEPSDKIKTKPNKKKKAIQNENHDAYPQLNQQFLPSQQNQKKTKKFKNVPPGKMLIKNIEGYLESLSQIKPEKSSGNHKALKNKYQSIETDKGKNKNTNTNKKPTIQQSRGELKSRQTNEKNYPKNSQFENGNLHNFNSNSSKIDIQNLKNFYKNDSSCSVQSISQSSGSSQVSDQGNFEQNDTNQMDCYKNSHKYINQNQNYRKNSKDKRTDSRSSNNKIKDSKTVYDKRGDNIRISKNTACPNYNIGQVNNSSLQQILIDIITKYNRLLSKHYKCKESLNLATQQNLRLHQVNQFKDFQIQTLKSQNQLQRQNKKQSSRQNISSSTMEVNNFQANKLQSKNKIFEPPGIRRMSQNDKNDKRYRKTSGKTINIQKMFVIDNVSMKKNDRTVYHDDHHNDLKQTQFNFKNQTSQLNSNGNDFGGVSVENQTKKRTPADKSERSASSRDGNRQHKGILSDYLFNTIDQRTFQTKNKIHLHDDIKNQNHLNKISQSYSTTLPNAVQETSVKAKKNKFQYKEAKTFQENFFKYEDNHSKYQYSQDNHKNNPKKYADVPNKRQASKSFSKFQNLISNPYKKMDNAQKSYFYPETDNFSRSMDLRNNQFSKSYNSISFKRNQSANQIKFKKIKPNQFNQRENLGKNSKIFYKMQKYNENKPESDSQQDNQIGQTLRYFAKSVRNKHDHKHAQNQYNNVSQSTDNQLLEKLLEIKRTCNNNTKSKVINTRTFFN